MELYFLRHADAAKLAPKESAKDSDRPLTLKGVRELKNVVHGMQAKGLSFDKIVSSPYVRAKETAKIIADGVQFTDEIELSKALLPSADFEDLKPVIKESRANEKILLVGHMPSLGGFVSSLVSEASQGSVEMKTGSLCFVDISSTNEPLSGKLKWLLTPEQMGGNS